MHLKFIVTVVILSCSSLRAGISDVSAQREIFTNAGVLDLGGKTETSTELGVFDRSLESRFVNDLLDMADASTSQRSSITNGSVMASGTIRAGSGDDIAQFQNTIFFSFAVDSPTAYELTSEFRFSDYNGAQTVALTPFYHLRFSQVGEPVPIVLKQVSQHDIGFSSTQAVEDASEGVLQPGRYELFFEIRDVIAGGTEEGAYQLNFSTFEGPPTAVPLPPAGWAGLLTLAVLAAWNW